MEIESNQRKLLIHMMDNKINARQVAEKVGKSHITIRKYRCGMLKVSDEILNEIILKTTKQTDTRCQHTEDFIDAI